MTGQLIKTFGLRKITYHINNKYLTVNFVVCDVKIPVLSVSILADKGFTSLISTDKSALIFDQKEVCEITRRETHFYLMPDKRLSYEETQSIIAPVVDLSKIDHWKTSGNLLIRVHNKLRQGMFIPIGVKDLPVDLRLIQPERHTIVNYDTGRSTKLDDYGPTVLWPIEPWVRNGLGRLTSRYKQKMKPWRRRRQAKKM